MQWFFLEAKMLENYSSLKSILKMIIITKNSLFYYQSKMLEYYNFQLLY